MKDLLKALVGAGITIGLADRDNFVKNVEEIIKEYQGDPVIAGRWSRAVADYLQGVKENINLQQAMKGVMDDASLPDKKNIEELTTAIKELSKQLKENK